MRNYINTKINDKFNYGKPSLLSNKSLKIIYTNISTSLQNMNIQRKKLFNNYYYGL